MEFITSKGGFDSAKNNSPGKDHAVSAVAAGAPLIRDLCE
jgi:hypothetical protein